MRSATRHRLALLALLGASALWTARLCQAQTPAPAADEQVTSAPAPPTAPAPEARPWYEAIGANAFLSASYSYGFNAPPSRGNQYRVFDFDNKKLKIDVAELVFQRAVSKPGELGFRVDAEAGSSIPRVSTSFGLLQGESSDLQQVFLSLITPVGSGLRLDAGKFVTHFGYEVIDGYDGFNDNATRSFLFGYAIPFTHTGLKASYTFGEKVTAMLEVVNGWDVAKDNNGAKSVGAQVGWTPLKSLSLTANFITGAERPDSDGDRRTDYELVAQWKATDRAVFALDLNRGNEVGAVAPGEDAVWWAAAGYARITLTPAFALSVRAEVFDDRDGARTGVRQTLEELTLTPELKLGSHVVVRGDFRLDRSNEGTFEKHDGSSGRSQPTLLLNALYYF